MIFVTRFDGKKVVINADLIEMIEETPETMVSMTTGKKITIKEKIDEVVEKVKQFKNETNYPVVKKNENS